MDNYQLDLALDHDFRPLAARMRPQTIEQYVGQSHLLAIGKPLRTALEQGVLHSMILWGPTGCGKTTLASLAANYCAATMLSISAVTAGIKEIRQAILQAKELQLSGMQTILFVDEVHRFNKSQQDAFLPHIEDGTIIFIGATTENPSFALNNALLSRARVYKLTTLSVDEIVASLHNAISDLNRGLGAIDAKIHDHVLTSLANLSDGDTRVALNYLEILYDMAPLDEQKAKVISLDLLANLSSEKLARFDHKGDLWYDLISAVHKSIRGSDPNAALYWAARMINAGCDPLYIVRRLLAIASEDIGNADPKAMQVALAAWDCFERVGAYEGNRAIAQAIVYLACAPKSNAIYTAWAKALDDAANLEQYEVPLHLRNAPTKLMSDLGYAKQYRYAHDEPGAYVAGETYLPYEIQDRKYYQPTDRGFERKIMQKLSYLANLDQKANNNK